MITAFSGTKNLKGLATAAGAKLYLDARKATGTGLPSNSPLTSPWVDLSENSNSATPTNFAGTTSSGVDTSDSKRPYWVLDGTDDIFTLTNTASIDILASPLSIFATFYLNSPAQNGFLFCKNTSLATDIQYGLLYDNTNTRMTGYFNGAAKGSGAAISTLTWYNVGFIWDGTTVKYYRNGVSGGVNGSLTGSLTTASNVRVGARSTGASNTGFVKGRIATLSVYSGSNCTEANVIAAEKAISKAYIS